MKNYKNFINESKDIWQRPSTKDETYGPIYYIKRVDFKSGVYNGDIVKLDKEYIESLDDKYKPWRDDNGKTTRTFLNSEYESEYILVNYTYEYGYALRYPFSNIEDHNFLGWVPTGYIRHLTNEEMKDYLYKKDIFDNSVKFNL